MVVTMWLGKPAVVSAERIDPRSGPAPYLTWSSVPPVNSIPGCSPKIGRTTSAARFTTIEIVIHRWRLPMKSNFGSLKIWNTLSSASDAQRFHPGAARENHVEHQPRDEHRGEHGRGEADDQRHGEAAHRTRPVRQQEERRDQGGHVHVHDRPEGPAEPLRHRGPHRLPRAQLLA